MSLPEAAALAAAVEALAGVDVHVLQGREMVQLLEDLETATRRLAGTRARLLDALESDGRWALDGSRSFAAWLQRTTGASTPEAGRSTRTARALREHLPLTAAALEDGSITAEHAQILASNATTTPERRAQLAQPEIGEAFLVGQAQRFDATRFASLVRAWAIAADPSGADGDHADHLDRQELVLVKVLHGYQIKGWLDDADGAVLDAALDAVIGVPSASDSRTPAQRRAAALVALARLALDGGTLSPSATVRTQLTVHVRHETLEALVAAQEAEARRLVGGGDAGGGDAGVGVVGGGDAGDGDVRRAGSAGGGWPDGNLRAVGEPFAGPGRFAWTSDEESATEESSSAVGERSLIPGGLDHRVLVGTTPAELADGSPIPPSLLARLACDSELSRVIFGPTGEVLDVGRAKRLFPPAQRRGVIARDRTCRWPGCDAPPANGEIHHALWWYAHRGPTSIENGLLLCYFHHSYVHTHAISIRQQPAGANHAARWVFTGRDGREITARPPRAGARRLDRGDGTADPPEARARAS